MNEIETEIEKGRIKKYGFIEGGDFSISCSPNWASAKIKDLARGQDKIDYRLTLDTAARPGDEDIVLNVTFLVKKRIYQQITQAAKKLLEDGKHEELVTDTILDWHSSPTVAPYAKLSILR